MSSGTVGAGLLVREVAPAAFVAGPPGVQAATPRSRATTRTTRVTARERAGVGILTL
jgi:hypothetical protein